MLPGGPQGGRVVALNASWALVQGKNGGELYNRITQTWTIIGSPQSLVLGLDSTGGVVGEDSVFGNSYWDTNQIRHNVGAPANLPGYSSQNFLSSGGNIAYSDIAGNVFRWTGSVTQVAGISSAKVKGVSDNGTVFGQYSNKTVFFVDATNTIQTYQTYATGGGIATKALAPGTFYLAQSIPGGIGQDVIFHSNGSEQAVVLNPPSGSVRLDARLLDLNHLGEGVGYISFGLAPQFPGYPGTILRTDAVLIDGNTAFDLTSRLSVDSGLLPGALLSIDDQQEFGGYATPLSATSSSDWQPIIYSLATPEPSPLILLGALFLAGLFITSRRA